MIFGPLGKLFYNIFQALSLLTGSCLSSKLWLFVWNIKTNEKNRLSYPDGTTFSTSYLIVQNIPLRSSSFSSSKFGEFGFYSIVRVLFWNSGRIVRFYHVLLEFYLHFQVLPHRPRYCYSSGLYLDETSWLSHPNAIDSSSWLVLCLHILVQYRIV